MEPLDQDQDQIPDDQEETKEVLPINPVAVTDYHPLVVDSKEYPPRQYDPLDELVTRVESLEVQDTDTPEIHCEVVLRRDLDRNIRIINARFSPRRHRLTTIPAPFAEIVTRNGLREAYNIIHKPETYIEKVLMNDAVF
ncbi:hypothetical protein HDU81_004400 [Chytriomyces hyalinus]|nr:hypothetical protein HDU81_004400 [Chytriomyces hyalinus]